MAIVSVCAKLAQGLDSACSTPVRKYYQQAVLINKSDIISYEITHDPETGAYNVTFELTEGTKGYRISGSEAGSSFFGSNDLTRDETSGLPQYTHNVQLLVAGTNEISKNVLHSLDNGSYVAALQLKDGTVEVYGIGNGLVTTDRTQSIQENGGSVLVTMASQDSAAESYLPLIYQSSTEDGEAADFDSEFAA